MAFATLYPPVGHQNYSASNTLTGDGSIPNPGERASRVWVDVNGTTGTFQEAIDHGYFISKNAQGEFTFFNLSGDQGSLLVTGVSGSPELRFFEAMEGHRANIVRDVMGLGFGVSADGSDPGYNHLFITNTGRVGINTTGPAGTLDIAGTLCIAGDCRAAWPDGFAESGAVAGTGNTNYIARWLNNTHLGVGSLYDNGTYVAIGTETPAARFTVHNGAILATGTTGSTPVSGSGTRLMWIPEKAAFRAGEVDGNQWDDSNIGPRSIALGQNVRASGVNSLALGTNTVASSDESTAFGSDTTASNIISTAFGYQTTASGAMSTAFGSGTTASGS
ncbi:MAG: hypothetical protein ACMXYF_05755, partial [Candidatus Woesearchaeota archaeon]